MAKLLPVKIYPDPILQKRATEMKVAEFKQPKFQQLVLDMEKTMKEKDGIGLAAPQVGQSIRLSVINTEDGTLVLINPKIIRKSFKKEVSEEGCLSVPDVYGLVKRSVKIKVTAQNKKGEQIKFRAQGLFARVIQHEIDHLDGVLFIDRARKITKGEDVLGKLKESIA